MKTARLLLSLVGLIAISLAYITHNLYFLVIAIGAFIAGLYFMGAIGQRSDQNKKPVAKKDPRNKKKDRNTD
jgi:hypothetical protein